MMHGKQTPVKRARVHPFPGQACGQGHTVATALLIAAEKQGNLLRKEERDMTGHRYTLLLNEGLKRHILALGPKDKKRLREKFEFLEAGLWDSGLQVKKLKGASDRVVFEGRFSKSDRLIFTLGRHDHGTAVYIWGLVKHDDVAKALQKTFPDNAPFLDFPPDAIEEYPEVLIDDLPRSYFSQEAVEQRVTGDYGPQKWVVLNEGEWERMLLAAGPEDFEIHLYLTTEQARVLETAPPLLLSGTAGSGKTTISVYYLLRKDFLDRKRLFLTYNRFLRDFSQRIYAGLVSRTRLQAEDHPPDFYVFRNLLEKILGASGCAFAPDREVGLREFMRIFVNHRLHGKYDAELVWEEIRSIIKGAKPPLRQERFDRICRAYIRNGVGPRAFVELRETLLGLKNLEVGARITAFLQKRTPFSGLDPLAQALAPGQGGSPSIEEIKALEGILEILEKRAKGLSSPLLTYEEYLNLGRKRAPNFLYERKEIYDIAEYYQSKLDETGQWDEIDLCRRAADELGKTEGPVYDLVVCDEVQDFADIQLSLIFRLAASHRAIVLTGDPKQIINPSGFRWEEVRNRFYERGVEIPPVFHLNLNFRSVGSIVRLSNALLELKQSLIGLSGSELREEWKFNGRPPFLLVGIEEHEILSRLAIRGAGRVLLVRDAKEQRRLKKALQTELVFTIHEAKGLEFDTVLVWKFSADGKSSSLWRRIKDEGHFDRTEHPHIRHEINLLYVAITRARNNLIFFDPAGDVWEVPQLREHVFRTNENDAVSEIWQRVSTPEEWERQGDYFFEREHYPAAAECYKNAGKPDRLEISRAFVQEKRGQYGPAGDLFEKHGYLERAAACLEKAGEMERALALWERLGEREHADLCRIAWYEKTARYHEAGDASIRRGDVQRAMTNWKKAGAHGKIGDRLFSEKRYADAAQAFMAARDYARAASAYAKARQYEKAADLYYRLERWTEAIALYKKRKNLDRLIACYGKIGDDYHAGLLCERARRVEEAIGHLSRFAASSADNRAALLREAEAHAGKKTGLKAAIRFSALSMYDRSAPLFLARRQPRLALAQYQSLGDHEKTAQCYKQLGDWLNAAVEIEQSDAPGWATTAETLLRRHLYANPGNRTQMELRLIKDAEALSAKGLHERALVRYKAVNAPDHALEVYKTLDRDEEALGWLLANDRMEAASEFIREKKDLAVSGNFIRDFLFETSADREGSDPWRTAGKKESLGAELLLAQLNRARRQELIDLAERFLNSIFFFGLDVPKPILDLILEIKHYNAVLKLAKFSAPLKGKTPKAATAFFDELQAKAERENDAGLLACCHVFKRSKDLDAWLEALEVSRSNFELFAESRQAFGRAVDYLLSQGRIEDAAAVCRRNRDLHRAGRVLEDAGRYAMAAREYRDGRLYEDALRCYRQAGDLIGQARVYEKVGLHEEALSLWRGLGNTRETARIEKKNRKSPARSKQLGLF
jgi:hypothetical protein